MTWEDVLKGLAAVASVALAYLAYKRSLKVDAISAQSGVADSNRAGIAQIIDALQEDNKVIREANEKLQARVDAMAVEIDALKREVARLVKKYGENGEPAAPR